MKIIKLKQFITILIALFPLVIPIIVSGQAFETATDTLVAMVNKTNDAQTVTILDNNNLVVKISLSEFRNHIDNGLKRDSLSEYYNKLLDILTLISKNEKSINISGLLKADNDLYRDFEYWIAFLLENARCLVLNTKTGEIISVVRLQKYIFYIAPGEFSSEGRRFYANEILILQVEDVIS